MDLSKLYEFSKSFGPPKKDLRFARIADDWGDDKYAKMPILHKFPEDVTIEELNYYPPGWAFMDIDSVLFYAFSVFKYHGDPANKEFSSQNGNENFFYFLDRHIDILVKKESIEVLFDSIKIMWYENPFFFDLIQCPKLQDVLDIHVTFEDESKYFDEKYPLE